MKYHYWYKRKKRIVSVRLEKSFLINDICALNLKTCKALKAVNKRFKKKKSQKITQGNVGAAHCENLKGNLLVLTSDKGEDTEFCLFSDKTMIDVYALFKSKNKGAKK